MKRNHPPGGKRLCLRLLTYALAFIAVIGMRETFTHETGPVSKQLGVIYNETLKAGSKLVLGFALMSYDEDDTTSLKGRSTVAIGQAAYRGFICATRVDIYGL